MNCPECGKKMAKSGWVFSGRKKCQRYKCSFCGRARIDSKERKPG